MPPCPSSGYRHTHRQNEYVQKASLLPARTYAILPWGNSTAHTYRHTLLLSSRGPEPVLWCPAFRDTFRETQPRHVAERCRPALFPVQLHDEYQLHPHIATPAK